MPTTNVWKSSEFFVPRRHQLRSMLVQPSLANLHLTPSMVSVANPASPPSTMKRQSSAGTDQQSGKTVVKLRRVVLRYVSRNSRSNIIIKHIKPSPSDLGPVNTSCYWCKCKSNELRREGGVQRYCLRFSPNGFEVQTLIPFRISE